MEVCITISAYSTLATLSLQATHQPEIRFDGGILTSGNNMVGDSDSDSHNTNSPITTYQASDIRDRPPMLGPLQNNGGTTPTRVLLIGSPAIDTGDNTMAVNPFNSSPLNTDQRGFTRIVDAPLFVVAVVNISAYEFTADPTAANAYLLRVEFQMPTENLFRGR